ncbi:MAG: ABC transporter ATP-binding protein [Treponemataceae bacterium]
MNKKLFKFSASIMKPFFWALFMLMFFSLFVNYVNTFEPYFTGKIIDCLNAKNKNSFFYYLRLVIIFQVANLGFSILSTICQYFLQRKITIYTESRLYINLLYTSSIGNKKDSGNILNLFLSDLATMTEIYTSQIPSILVSLVIAIVIGFRLFKIDILLFCLTIIVSIIPILLAKYFGKKQAIINAEQKKCQDKYTTYVNETIEGLHEIHNYSAQKFFRLKFKTILDFIFIHIKRSTIVGVQSNSANYISNATINIALFVIVGMTVLNGKNTVGTITAALMYSQKFRGIISSVSQTFKNILVSFVSVERIKTIFDSRINNNFIQYKTDIGQNKSIKIKNLNFAYKDKKSILKKLNAEFQFPGLYLIKGENGSGKTTFLNILSKNIVPDKKMFSGEIVFYNFSPCLSYVSQNPFVFSASIKENLTFGKNFAEVKIQSTLEKTKLKPILENLPDGLETKLGANAEVLSQGQIQRLALARAILQNSEVLLFDEVESAIDRETNLALLELLSELKTQKLILMITHRTNYDKIADGIFKL